MRGISWRGVRDVLLVVAGIALTANEAIFYQGPERWGLYMLYAGMMGLPVMLRSDDHRAGREEPTPPPDNQETDP